MKLKKIVTREENFADWYTSVVTAANLVLYSSIKGVMIFQPNGWSIWQNIIKELDIRFLELGIQNVQLPLFIKYSDFVKEAEHVEGFAPETFMVTKKGKENLDEPYVIRPTSEVLFCDYFKKIVNSYNDLPLLYNQWCNVFRAEKTTRPFLRNSEFFWHELHTVHSSSTEAMTQTTNMLELYKKFVREFLCMPVLFGEKTEGERFAGAKNTYSIEAIMQDGQALQCGTSHYLAQNFSKTYEMKFQTKDNTSDFMYQTSAGLSTRLIGGIIMVHADDKGLVLPVGIAPTQIAILPIFFDKNPRVMEVALKLKEALSNYRVKIDNSPNGFGHKMADQEVSGTPISIVVGPKDLENDQVTVVRRDTSEKTNVFINDIKNHINSEITEFQKNIFNRAEKNLQDSIVETNTLDEFLEAIGNQKVAIAKWGGTPEDEKMLKQKTNATPRVIKSPTLGKCFFTGKEAKYLIYFARAY